MMEAFVFLLVSGFFGVSGWRLARYVYRDRASLKATYDGYFQGRHQYWKEFSFDRLGRLETVIEQLRESLTDATKKRAEWQVRAQSLVGIPQAQKNGKKK